MNIVSTMVGLSIMGAAAPAVLQMSLAPVEAQARSRNFALAETSAVSFSANWEGAKNPDWINDPTLIPTNCNMPVETGNRAYDITCRGGAVDSEYRQEVTRAFKLEPQSLGAYTNPTREFGFQTPLKFSHVPCQVDDPWGVIWYNNHLAAGNLDACIPQAAFSEKNYLDSNPDDWLFDLSNFGFGTHPDF